MNNAYSNQIDSCYACDTSTEFIESELSTNQTQEGSKTEYFTTKDGRNLKVIGKFTGWGGVKKLILEGEDCSWLVAEEPECENKTESNSINHPLHHTQGSIECIDAMVSAYGADAVMDFCKCNAFKYLWRFNHKNSIEDLDKLQWYINKYKDLYYLKEQTHKA